MTWEEQTHEAAGDTFVSVRAWTSSVHEEVVALGQKCGPLAYCDDKKTLKVSQCHGGSQEVPLVNSLIFSRTETPWLLAKNDEWEKEEMSESKWETEPMWF